MSELKGAIIPTLVTFLVTLVLNTFISYFSGPRGEITKAENIEIEGKKYAVVDIINFSHSTLNGIVLTISEQTKVENISYSQPITVSTQNPSPSGSGLIKLEVSGVFPNSQVKIFIPSSSPVNIVNASEKNVRVLDQASVSDPLKDILIEASIVSLFYAIIFFIFDSIQLKRVRNIEQNREKIVEELHRVEGKHDEAMKALEEKTGDAEGKVSRMQILMLSRLRDYSKELDFWRNTIRKVLYSGGVNNKQANSLIIEVTEGLKTYQTRENSDASYFKSIEVLANMMSKEKPNNGNFVPS